MIIDVKKLNAKKEYSGRLQFTLDGKAELIPIPFVEFASPLSVDVDFELYDDDALSIQGEVTFLLKGKCSRCLNDASQLVKGEISALFEPFTGGEDYAYENGKVDLTPAVDDAVMACMPFSLSCGENCVGLQYSDEDGTNHF